MSQRFSPRFGLLWKMSQLAVRHKKATSSPSLLHQCFCSRFHKYSKLKKINLFSTIFFSGVHTLASVCLKVLMIQVQQFTSKSIKLAPTAFTAIFLPFFQENSKHVTFPPKKSSRLLSCNDIHEEIEMVAFNFVPRDCLLFILGSALHINKQR